MNEKEINDLRARSSAYVEGNSVLPLLIQFHHIMQWIEFRSCSQRVHQMVRQSSSPVTTWTIQQSGNSNAKQMHWVLFIAFLTWHSSILVSQRCGEAPTDDNCQYLNWQNVAADEHQQNYINSSYSVRSFVSLPSFVSHAFLVARCDVCVCCCLSCCRRGRRRRRNCA